MQSDLRISRQGLLLLAAFLNHPLHAVCGAELMKVTKLPSGTVYPILLRYEHHGLLTSDWESEDPAMIGRPRRRLYRLTRSGAAQARTALREISSLIPALRTAR